MIERYYDRIIPVVDIKGGKVVHAKRGERDKYKPLITKLSLEANPVEFVKNLNFNRIYVADLDSIMFRRPNLNILEIITKIRKTLLDVGIRNYDDYIYFKKKLNCDIIVASETLKNEKELENIVKKDRNVIFSIDIKDMKVISNFLPEDIKEAFKYIRENFGIKRFIFINMSAIGTLSMRDFNKFRFLLNESVETYYGGGINESSIENAFKIFNFLLIGTLLYNNWRVENVSKTT